MLSTKEPFCEFFYLQIKINMLNFYYNKFNHNNLMHLYKTTSLIKYREILLSKFRKENFIENFVTDANLNCLIFFFEF